jgi:hypothetical protein
MSMENWWNDTDKGKAKVLEEKPVSAPLLSSTINSIWIE